MSNIKNFNNSANYRRKRDIGPSIEDNQPIHNHNYYSQNNALTPFMKTVYFAIGAIAVVAFIFGVLSLTGYINYNDIPVSAIDANIVKNSSKDDNTILLEDNVLSFQTSKVSEPQIEILNTGVNINQDVDMNSKSMTNVSDITMIDDNNKVAKLDITGNFNMDLSDLTGSGGAEDLFIINGGNNKFLKFRKNGDLFITGALIDSSGGGGGGGGGGGNNFSNINTESITFKDGNNLLTVFNSGNTGELVIDTTSTNITGTDAIQFKTDDGTTARTMSLNQSGDLIVGGSVSSNIVNTNELNCRSGASFLTIDATDAEDNNDAIRFITNDGTQGAQDKTMTLNRSGDLTVDGDRVSAKSFRLNVYYNNNLYSSHSPEIYTNNSPINTCLFFKIKTDAIFNSGNTDSFVFKTDIYSTIVTPTGTYTTKQVKIKSNGNLVADGIIQGSSLATNGNRSIIFPTTNPTTNQVLKVSGTDNNGVTTLVWADDSNDGLPVGLTSITNGIQFGPDQQSTSINVTGNNLVKNVLYTVVTAGSITLGFWQSIGWTGTGLPVQGDTFVYNGNNIPTPTTPPTVTKGIYTNTHVQGNQNTNDNTRSNLTLKGDQYIFMGTSDMDHMVSLENTSTGGLIKINSTSTDVQTQPGYAIRTREKIYSVGGFEGPLTGNVTGNVNTNSIDYSNPSNQSTIHNYIGKDYSLTNIAKIKISNNQTSNNSYGGILYTTNGGFQQYKQDRDNDVYRNRTQQYIRKIGDNVVKVPAGTGTNALTSSTTINTFTSGTSLFMHMFGINPKNRIVPGTDNNGSITSIQNRSSSFDLNNIFRDNKTYIYIMKPEFTLWFTGNFNPDISDNTIAIITVDANDNITIVRGGSGYDGSGNTNYRLFSGYARAQIPMNNSTPNSIKFDSNNFINPDYNVSGGTVGNNTGWIEGTNVYFYQASDIYRDESDLTLFSKQVFNLDLSNVVGNQGDFLDKFWLTTNNAGQTNEVKFNFTAEGNLSVPNNINLYGTGLFLDVASPIINYDNGLFFESNTVKLRAQNTGQDAIQFIVYDGTSSGSAITIRNDKSVYLFGSNLFMPNLAEYTSGSDTGTWNEVKRNLSTGQIKYDGTGNSDDRIKFNETLISNALNSIMNLSPQTYDKAPSLDQLDDPSIRSFEAGLIAQDIYYDTPEFRHLVGIPSDANPSETKPPTPDDIQDDPDYSDWGTTPATVNYKGFVPYIIAGMQELKQEKDAEILALQTENQELRTLIENLTSRVAALE